APASVASARRRAGTDSALASQGVAGAGTASADGDDSTLAASPPTLDMRLEEGTVVAAPNSGDVRIGGAGGTMLTLEHGGGLGVGQQTATRRFALDRGSVRARVAKLKKGDRFIISTEDAEVEGHGTIFH